MTHKIDVINEAGGHLRYTCVAHVNNLEWRVYSVAATLPVAA